MKQIVFLLIILLLITACSKDTDDKLEGKWQLRQTESAGLVTSVDTVWYNFQNGLFSYAIYDAVMDEYISQYGFKNVEEGKLLLEFDNYPRAVEEFLPLTDWESKNKIYTITKLSGSTLILTDERGNIYSFHKF